jgi:IclR family transcriptional regulator, acetate operon repressor
VISRVALILQILTSSRSGLTLAEVVTQSGLPKTTAHRILSALQEERLVEGVEGRYYLGRVLDRGLTAETEQVRLRARHLMERVASELQETVDLTILVDDQVMIIEQILRRQEAGGPMVGSRLPALVTASGLALLACSRRHEPSGLTTPRPGLRIDDTSESLATRLKRVREDGIAVSMYDIPGVLAMATAATDETGLAFALGVPVPRDRSAHKAPLIHEALLRARPEFQRLVSDN